MRFGVLAAAAALLLGLAACGEEKGIRVEQARVMLPVVADRPGSAYFIARSADGEGRLTRITSPRVERIELHETLTENGVSRMEPLQGAGFDDKGEINFQPGGKHAMLFGIDPQVKAGDRIPLTFHFEPGPALTVEAEVLPFGGGGHEGH